MPLIKLFFLGIMFNNNQEKKKNDCYFILGHLINFIMMHIFIIYMNNLKKKTLYLLFDYYLEFQY